LCVHENNTEIQTESNNTVFIDDAFLLIKVSYAFFILTVFDDIQQTPIPVKAAQWWLFCPTRVLAPRPLQAKRLINKKLHSAPPLFISYILLRPLGGQITNQSPYCFEESYVKNIFQPYLLS
jgi:hypothetical protein